VSLSVSGVSGPYTGVNCTLRLAASQVRLKPNVSTGLVALTAPIQAIVTSGGQTDSGLFETNLRDERYLPFEGAGVVGTWSIDMPASTNAFDLAQVSDVVLHLRYTARDGGAAFRSAVEASEEYFKTRDELHRLIDVRSECSTVWAAFVSLGAAEVPVSYADFPYLRNLVGVQPEIDLTEIKVYVRKSDAVHDLAVSLVPLDGPVEGIAPSDWTLDTGSGLRIGTWSGSKTIEPAGSGEVDALRLAVSPTGDAASIQDVFIVLTYKQMMA
jgi:hypothetical protein